MKRSAQRFFINEYLAGYEIGQRERLGLSTRTYEGKTFIGYYGYLDGKEGKERLYVSHP